MRPIRKRSSLLCAVLGALALASRARAEGPVLRIETGLPLSEIAWLQADAAGRVLALSGREPVVRVLDALTGATVQTLRLPPDGQGSQLSALALSPAGDMVAAATWRADPGEAGGRGALLLVTRQTGAVRRLGLGPADHVRALAFSPDGARLGAALGEGGLRLFDVRRGAEIGRDPEPCALLDVGAAVVAAAGPGGALGVYDAALQPLRRLPAARPVRGLRLSPDGGKLALSYEGEPRLEVLSARDLSAVSRPDTAGLRGELPALGWSRSGALLYAAGPGAGTVRRFSAGGRGPAEDLPAGAGPITGLASLPNDGLAFAGAGPAVGALSAGGRRIFLRGRGAGPGRLAVDRGGTRARFVLPPEAGAPAGRAATFFLPEHTLRADADGKGIAAIAEAPLPAGVALSQGGLELRIGETVVPLPPGETGRCAAAAPDKKTVLVGTARSLLGYGQDGAARFQVPLPAAADRLQLSVDGQLAVAALADGTLRWYAAQDGRPLLSLVADPEGRRWAAFTPSGYYDASAAGEDLLGWEVSRGADAAQDFFRAGLFRQRLYRPELVARVLLSLDEGRAIEESLKLGGGQRPPPLERLLPPVVRVLDPPDQALVREGQVSMRVAVRSPSGQPVTSLRVLVNGVKTATRGLVVEKMGGPGQAGAGEVEKRISVPLPGEDATLAVIAETGFARSEAVTVHLRRQGSGPQIAEARPDLNVLSIGVSRYRDASLQLGYPAKDARDLSAAFAGQQGKRYGTVRTRVLTDGQASRAAVLEGLLWLRQQTRPGDLSVLFLAGHGLGSAEDGKYYFLPYDADPASPEETMVDAAQLQATLASIPGRVLLFLDTCHSGSVLGPRDRSARDLLRLVSEMASVESGVVVYAASTGGQQSREAQKWGNGAFTKALVEGLKGKADLSQTGRVTVSSLEHYVSERVRELTLQAQTPTTAKPSTTPDFLLASVPVRIQVQKKWWFWGAMGVAAAGLVTGLSLGLRPGDPVTDGGRVNFTFPMGLTVGGTAR